MSAAPIPAIAANKFSPMSALKLELEHAYFEVTSKKQNDVKYKVFVAKKCENCQSFFQEVATHVCIAPKSTGAKTSTAKTPVNLKSR